MEGRRDEKERIAIVDGGSCTSERVDWCGSLSLYFCKDFLLGKEVTYNKTYKSTLPLR